MIKSEKKELLRKIYLKIYNDFATSTNEIMAECNITRSQALRLLNTLEGAGLLCGDLQEDHGRGVSWTGRAKQRSVGQNILWQCWVTYDSEDTPEAEKRIDLFLVGA